jgi:ubiquinone/menaquinone biosynthesis C-methylase UbiE
VVRGFEQTPWAYDAFMTVVEAFGFRRWRHWLVDGSKGVTLEVGAGTGRNLPLFKGRSAVVGVDPDLRSLLVARRRAPGVPLVAATAEALPFADDAFDTVVSCLVLCSVRDPAQSMAELSRVLRPRGMLRMLEHVRSSSRLIGRLQDLAQPAWTRCTGGCHPNRSTEATLAESGFRTTTRANGRRTLRRLVATHADSETGSTTGESTVS